MYINVTQDIIESGTPEDPRLCPIGVATHIAKAGTEFENHAVEVQDCTIYLNAEDGTGVCAALPQNAIDFIDSFDLDHPVWPIEFDLEFANADY